MSGQSTKPDPENANVIRMGDRRAPDRFETALPNLPRLKVEVTCNQDLGDTIKNVIASQLRARSYLVDDHDKPDWILSIIAFRHGEMVEMSIILRELFRSTTPGTEVELLDAEGHVGLRQGGWLYESLRFHGLFGVPAVELDSFSERLAKDLATSMGEVLGHSLRSSPPGRRLSASVVRLLSMPEFAAMREE